MVKSIQNIGILFVVVFVMTMVGKVETEAAMAVKVATTNDATVIKTTRRRFWGNNKTSQKQQQQQQQESVKGKNFPFNANTEETTVYASSAVIVPTVPDTVTQNSQDEVVDEQVIDHNNIQTNAGKIAGLLDRALNKENNTIEVPKLLIALEEFAKLFYSSGQSLAGRELHSNMNKVNSCTGSAITDMEELLLHEKRTGIHKYDSNTGKLISLRDPSCAMGLLWIQRSLLSQYILFDAMLNDIPAKQASFMAYEQVIEKYHGWMLRKVYRLGLHAAAPNDNRDWLAKLGGFDIHNENFNIEQEQATRNDIQKIIYALKPLLNIWEDVYTKLDLNDVRRV